MHNTLYPREFRYFEECISPECEAKLLGFIERIPFRPYVMRGQASRRGIVGFGTYFGPVGGTQHEVLPFPGLVTELRDHCAALAGLDGTEFIASVVTQYSPGATIGWHSDMTMFGPVVFGISLLSDCIFKLRPKQETRSVYNITLQARSLYLMEGDV